MGSLDARSIAALLDGDATSATTLNVPGPGHSRADRSLSIKLDGSAPGGFIVHSHAGDDPMHCRDYVRGKLGLKRWAPERRSFAPIVLADSAQNPSPEEMKKFALSIWERSVPPVGTLAEQYLAETRGLSLPLDVAGRAVRFHGSLKLRGASAAAMVSLMRDLRTDEPLAIQRTFIDRQTGHKIDRLMLGPSKTAAIKIDAHASILSELVIGEGFETVLSARHAGFGPAWALGSAGAVRKFPLLDGVSNLTLLEENDATSKVATEECAHRYYRAGREVTIISPRIGKDFNDVWKDAQADLGWHERTS